MIHQPNRTFSVPIRRVEIKRVHPYIVFSSGGGTQSAAIKALIISGYLPRPDKIIMSNTGRERSATWRYLEEVTRPALADVGLDVEVVEKETYATVDLYSIKSRDLLIPAFTRQSGKLGKLDTYCSNEWKRRVIMRRLTDLNMRPCDNWLGISTNEAHRMKESDKKWMRHVYPLVELGLNRGDSFQIVKEMGWPPAPKSTCWMCPNMSNDTWRAIRDEDPGDLKKAVEFDEEIRREDPHVYVHMSGLPLRDADFDTQGELFDGCDSGYCHT